MNEPCRLNRLTAPLRALANVLLAAALLLGAAHVSAQVATVELRDGSALRGEVVSMDGGTLILETDSLGVVEIPTGDVRELRYGTASAGGGSGSAASAAALAGQLLSDPEVAGLIESLRDDPRVLAVVEDPEIQRAIAAGDYAALMSNPRFVELLDHAAVEDILRRVR